MRTTPLFSTRFLLAATALAAAWTSAASAQEQLTVDAIVKKTNHVAYYQGEDGRARVHMTITDSQDRTREREFSILRLDVNDAEDQDQKYYVYFHRPADVREMVFMVWKHLGQDDHRWLYLPALDLEKQIAASDERTSFVGSDFYYEDVSGRGIEEDHHELVDTGETYYVLKNTPKKPGLVEFDSYTMWIHKDSFIPVKIEYEKGGEIYRVAEALKVDEIQGFKTVTKSRMKDLDKGSQTLLEYKSVEYNIGLPEDIFTSRYMRKPPRKYLE